MKKIFLLALLPLLGNNVLSQENSALSVSKEFSSSVQENESIDITLGMRVASLRYAEVELPQGNLLPVWQSDKCGFLSLEGELVLAPTYDKDKSNSKYPVTYQFKEGLMRVLKNGKYGYINQSAEEVIACQYEDARDFSEGKAIVKIDGLWRYIDTQGRVVIEEDFKDVYSFSSGLAAVVNEKDSVGFIDGFGLVVIPFYFDKMEQIAFVDSYCVVRKLGTEYVIDKRGERVDVKIPKQTSLNTSKSDLERLRRLVSYDQADTPFDEVSTFQNGYAVVMKKGDDGVKRYGVLTKKGFLVVPCEYDQIDGPFSSAVTYFVVEKNGLLGAVKVDGSQLLPCQYEKVFSEGSELIMVQKNGLKGFVDKQGKEVITCQYEDVAPFNSSVTGVSVWKKDKRVWNFINQKGEVVSTPEYEEILTFYNGICPVKKKGKWGFVDTQMKPISSFKYDYSFSDSREKWSYRWSKSDLIPVLKEGKYGFINHLGKEVILCQYEDALSFSLDGLARVQINGKYGFINEKGEMVIPCKYEKATSFRNGVAIVTRGGNKYSLDKQGVERISQNVSENSELICMSQLVQKNGLYGLVNEEGKMLTAAIFDQVEPFENNMAPIKLVNKWGLIDCKGRILIPCIYDDLKANGEGLFSVKVAGKRGVVDANGHSIISGSKSRQVKWIPLERESIRKK